MKVFLVGGFCRDILITRLTGQPVVPTDRDYVVVGSSPEEMLSLGYKQVGADFPVFLAPEDGTEHALARKETKDGSGYGGFKYEWEGVTLTEDLYRRDLTINSIAWGSDFNSIDPFGGIEDIKAKTLRHTSQAFAEDPVRVLRVARLLAKLGPEWTVAPETYALCQKVAWAEFKHLTAERVFKEMDKALGEKHPELFFEFLYMLDYVWFKELFALKGVPQPTQHHPENCTFKHIMLCLKQGVKLGASQEELYAILCHDLGKAVCWTERGNLHGHEDTGLPLVNAMSDRLKVPNKYRDLALKVCKWHQYAHTVLNIQPKKVHKLLSGLGCIKSCGLLSSFIKCCTSDALGRTGLEDRPYKQADYLVDCCIAVQQVDSKRISRDCLEREKTGVEIGEEIRVAQINAIRGVKNQWKT